MLARMILVTCALLFVLCEAQYDPGNYVTQADMARCPIALGFDFPLGRPNSAGRRTYQATMRGYRVASGFMKIFKTRNRPSGGFHLGEDWNGRGGGNTDLGDPIYSIADGLVINIHSPQIPGNDGWGPVVRVLHKFVKSSGEMGYVVALYGHVQLLPSINVGDRVERGQLICRIGQGDGAVRYAHLHLELRTNVNLGIGWGYSYELPGEPANRERARSIANAEGYTDPTAFIRSHGKLAAPSPQQLEQDAVAVAQVVDTPTQPRQVRQVQQVQQAPVVRSAPTQQRRQSFPARGPWTRVGGAARDPRVKFETAPEHVGVDPCRPLTSIRDAGVRVVVLDNAEPGSVFELAVPRSYTALQANRMVWHLAACRNWSPATFSAALAVVDRNR